MPEKPAQEKTEQPTQRKLEKAREKGQVAQSQELPAVSSIFIIIVVLFLFSSQMGNWLIQLMENGIRSNTGVFVSTDKFMNFFADKVTDSLIVTAPFLIALFLGSAVACFCISGLNFSPESVKFKLDAINPIKGFGKLFNIKSLVKLGISVAKLIFIISIAAFYLKSRVDELASIRWAWSGKIVRAVYDLSLGLLIRVSIGLLLIAAVDTIFQKWKYIKDLMMTKQEVKDEQKETHGSPEVKKRVRQIQMEMSAKRMLEEVPEANVVLVNPTHYAVAVKYDPKEMDAPIVVAKGADNLAQKIREIARSYGVPVVRKPELTRTIFGSVELGDPIPQALYMAVAEVMAMVYRMRKGRKF